MPLIKNNGSRIIFLLAVMLFLTPSCQKDLSTTDGITSNPPIIYNPADKETSNDQFELTVEKVGNYKTGSITEKEVREIIQLKELLRALIKETLIQLLFNHDFNPLMPQINTRMDCVDCSEQDCGCPYQDPLSTNDPTPGVFPKTVTLKYYKDVADCTCTLATSPSGLKVYGEMILIFSDSLTKAGHSITMIPQDNFIVDGYDIDATSIQITQDTDNLERYNITGINNVVVTKDGNATRAISIDEDKSRITITDVNDNHGDIENAFGLLDDEFKMRIRSLELECSNGEHVIANSSEDLIYNMVCDNVQDGIMQIYECTTTETPTGPDGGGGFGGGFPGGGIPGGTTTTTTTSCVIADQYLLATYDYGFPAADGVEPVCDDEVDIIINTD